MIRGKWTRYGVASMVILVAGCGGGGGGATGTPTSSTQAYPNVQPAAAPAPEAVDTTRASGTVSVSADTFDANGHQGGIAVELHSIQSDGTLGPTSASTTTAPDGSFSIPMPAASSTADGNWMLLVRVGSATLRAYVYPGTMRADVSSEAWVREVERAAGKVLVFPRTAVATLKSVERSLALFSDSTGADRMGQTLDAAAEQIIAELSADHAMAYLVSTLASTNTLPANGTGDIGAFFAISDTYAGKFLDSAGAPILVTLRAQISGGTPMSADGSWAFRQQQFSSVNGDWTPIAGAGSDSRAAPNGLYTHLTGSGVAVNYLSGDIGEYWTQSFPLQPGTRELEARRIDHTGLNFTGGTDEQPISFSQTEAVGQVELVNIGAGQFRAVRVVNDTEIGMPNADGTVKYVTVRSTDWLVPGAGIVKELDEGLEDGVPAVGVGTESHELSSAYADSTVWPSRVTMRQNYLYGISTSHRCATPVASARRFITVESGPLVNGTPRLALSLWDMDTGKQIGSTRTFTGDSTSCPVVAGTSGGVFVVEAFSERNGMNIWPSDQATALSYSDVVHEISVTDLSDLATYRVAPVPDTAQPTLYQPAFVASLAPAPDASGDFAVGTVKSTYLQTSGDIPQYVQILGPSVASPIASLGLVLVPGVDWTSGQIFTSQSIGAYPLTSVPFTLGGAIPSSSRVISTNTFVPSIWYTSANYVHLMDGSSIRIADGSSGPHLPFTADRCGFGSGVLVCLDISNDQLVRYDPDSLSILGTATLGSSLRALSNVGPNFSTIITLYGGIPVWDSSTFEILGQDIHVGHWQ